MDKTCRYSPGARIFRHITLAAEIRERTRHYVIIIYYYCVLTILPLFLYVTLRPRWKSHLLTFQSLGTLQRSPQCEDTKNRH